MFGKYANLTDTVHKNSYKAISPLRPELSQAGRTVLVSGGTTGIGYGIACGFVKASAERVIIKGRRLDVVSRAVKDLEQKDGVTKIMGFSCDVSSQKAVEVLWDRLRKDGIVVDVLVLSAVDFGPNKPLRDMNTPAIWEVFDVNVRAQLQMSERFYKQEGRGGSETKYIVYVSSVSVHDFNIGIDYPSYALTKLSAQLGLQLIARDSPPEALQIISFHPGMIFTENARDKGYTEDSVPWDHVDLPGHFSVWAASPEAKFLHGRFVWATWDVEQLQSGDIRRRIDEDATYLKIGIHGL